jgi:hypothetical protein
MKVTWKEAYLYTPLVGMYIRAGVGLSKPNFIKLNIIHNKLDKIYILGIFPKHIKSIN